MPSERVVNALHEKATSALTQIVRTADSGQYNKIEVEAVKALLDLSAQPVTR